MRINKLFLLLVGMAIFIVTAPPPSANAADEKETPIWIMVNDVRFLTEELPFLEDGQLYLPLRAISERIGAVVKWTPPQKVTIERQNQKIELTINDRKVLAGEKEKQLSQTPRLINGCTFVTQDFFSDVMNFKVEWDEKIKVVRIDTGLVKIPIEIQ